MFLCSLIEELCTKEENDKTDCNFNFGHECIFVNKFKDLCIFLHRVCYSKMLSVHHNAMKELFFILFNISNIGHIFCRRYSIHKFILLKFSYAIFTSTIP